MKKVTLAMLFLALGCGAALAAKAPAGAKKTAAPEAKKTAVQTVEPKALKPGDKAPLVAFKKFRGDKDFVFLKYFCGESRKNAADKAVLLHFFSADCADCGPQLADLQSLNSQYAQKGLRTFLINVDPGPAGALQAYLTANKLNLLVLTDTNRSAFSEFGFSAAPRTVLLDDACKIVYVEGKGPGSNAGSKLKALLETAAQPPAAPKPGAK